jgi:hypothetical protein
MESIASATATFAMSFLSFVYSNMTRFKRFKGLGFEAELWEDKQKEAAELIERLKSIVSVYTEEIVMGKVKHGRWSDGDGWQARWDLYDKLVEHHNALGQEIDFSGLKREVDLYFVYDIVSQLSHKYELVIHKSKAAARSIIDKKLGPPLNDSKNQSQRLEQLREIKERPSDLFEIGHNGDAAAHVLRWGKEASEKLKKYFDVDLELDPEDTRNLELVSQHYSSRPIKVTSELIALADQH